jgi:hypothetical protein
MPILECTHEYVYSGIVYEVQEWKLPGSGASPVHYFDKYFCTHCLDQQFKQLAFVSNSYGTVMYDAKPKTVVEER